MRLFDSRRIDRLIYSVGRVPHNTNACLKLDGTHAKLWLCYHKHAVDAFIGSANATEMTLHELVVKLNTTQTLAAKRHFDELWKANQKPKS